jgi:hypothetical protein
MVEKQQVETAQQQNLGRQQGTDFQTETATRGGQAVSPASRIISPAAWLARDSGSTRRNAALPTRRELP